MRQPFASGRRVWHPGFVDTITGVELIKLLLQVVTADDVVTPAERTLLDQAARRLGGEAAVAVVKTALDDGRPLPPPNMGMLQQHRGVVLVEVARIGAIDGIHRDELDLVALISEMLS